MERLSEDAYRAFRALVYETPGFVDYFHASTPIREIAELHIGSRPASRKATGKIEDLRAIPWVFSWSASRVMLPGWYGFGSAVESWVQSEGDAGLARLRYSNLVSFEQFQVMLKNQEKACGICKKEVPLGVDHNHNTGKVRGLLCQKCNHAIGLLDEDPARFDEAKVWVSIS
jgi:phosphoenolpyruvate carboxylase